MAQSTKDILHIYEINPKISKGNFINVGCSRGRLAQRKTVRLLIQQLRLDPRLAETDGCFSHCGNKM